jgi:hypothetical protein
MHDQRLDFTEDLQLQLCKLDALGTELYKFHSEFWSGARYGYRNTEEIDDIKIEKDRIVLDNVYSEGKQQAFDAYYYCSEVYEILKYPTITCFIEDVEKWLNTHFINTETLMQQAKQVYKSYPKIYYLRELFDLYEDQKSKIKSVFEAFLKEAKASKQYLKENGIQMSTNNGNTYHNYGNMIVSTGNNNKIKLNANIPSHNEQAFRDSLMDSGLQKQDVDELLAVVKAETLNVKDEKLTPKINIAIHKVLAKCADGSWALGLGVAGNFLTDAVKAFIGI